MAIGAKALNPNPIRVVIMKTRILYSPFLSKIYKTVNAITKKYAIEENIFKNRSYLGISPFYNSFSMITEVINPPTVPAKFINNPI